MLLWVLDRSATFNFHDDSSPAASGNSAEMVPSSHSACLRFREPLIGLRESHVSCLLDPTVVSASLFSLFFASASAIPLFFCLFLFWKPHKWPSLQWPAHIHHLQYPKPTQYLRARPVTLILISLSSFLGFPIRHSPARTYTPRFYFIFVRTQP